MSETVGETIASPPENDDVCPQLNENSEDIPQKELPTQDGTVSSLENGVKSDNDSAPEQIDDDAAAEDKEAVNNADETETMEDIKAESTEQPEDVEKDEDGNEQQAPDEGEEDETPVGVDEGEVTDKQQALAEGKMDDQQDETPIGVNEGEMNDKQQAPADDEMDNQQDQSPDKIDEDEVIDEQQTTAAQEEIDNQQDQTPERGDMDETTKDDGDIDTDQVDDSQVPDEEAEKELVEDKEQEKASSNIHVEAEDDKEEEILDEEGLLEEKSAETNNHPVEDLEAEADDKLQEKEQVDEIEEEDSSGLNDQKTNDEFDVVEQDVKEDGDAECKNEDESMQIENSADENELSSSKHEEISDEAIQNETEEEGMSIEKVEEKDEGREENAQIVEDSQNKPENEDDTGNTVEGDENSPQKNESNDVEMVDETNDEPVLMIQDVRALGSESIDEKTNSNENSDQEKLDSPKNEDEENDNDKQEKQTSKEKVDDDDDDDDDVEMIENVEEKTKDSIEKTPAKSDDNKDVEMIENDSKADEKDSTADVKGMNAVDDSKDSEVKSEEKKSEETAVIDLQSDDEDKKPEVKEENGVEENKDEDGGLCLQIASVSGGADINLFKDDEMKQEEEKKSEDVKKEVTSSTTVKSEPDDTVKKEIKQESKPAASKPSSKAQTCIVCMKVGKCKYNIVRNGDIKHLCDDVCFKRFRSNPTMFLRAATDTPKPADSSSSAPSQPKPTPTQPPPQEHYKTCSICQLMNVKTSKPFLNWQGMDFCGEDCLGKFQSNLNASCSYCGHNVAQASKGKYCARVGNDVKQFCSASCFTEFKKRQKLCEFCQKDLFKCNDAFVAPVGKDGVFKDFCSQDCLQKYEEIINQENSATSANQVQKSQVPPKGNFVCAVCSKTGPVKHEIKLEGKMNHLCSDPCFSAFQYANKLYMNTCDNCGIYCYKDGSAPQFIQFEGQQKRFCTFMCVNTFKTMNKKVVSCAWCNCKKPNFDMIERVDANNKYQLFCSLNCLSLYRVNLQATSNQAVVCDQCRKCVPAQYHLTMSDASVRNFCSYQCVMSFQSQFSGGTKAQQPINNTAQGASPRVSTRASTKSATQQVKPNVPIISNVVSLAQDKKERKESPAILRGSQQQNFKVNAGNNVYNHQVHTSKPQQSSISTQVTQQIIIQPPPPKAVKNKSLLCKPFVQTKATSCRPHTQTKETQTDGEAEPKKIIIPVPIPYYVPVPMQMWSQPVPVPIPIPVPVPVPMFIPTTRKSANGILKQIKEIQERIPSDPLEAELLMMAEAVAGGEPESDSDTEHSDVEMEPPPAKTLKKPTSPASPPHSTDKEVVAPAETSEFGEDMLQMALRMATEMTSEPVMDLETSIDPVPVNTEPPPPPQRMLDDDESSDYTPVRETRSRGRGQKRSGGGRGRRSKRQKLNNHSEQPDISMEEQIPAEPEPQEPPPDANFYLKYTYGVNAWKHWVVQKNNQLDKVSKTGSGKLKLFKTDMMGCSADELNYSLCLFVKEVRKPNGEEYAPDSIQYLCLGIQQYLFENGRIDNIFTDVYYEKFTECLNEVLARYEPRVNTAGQLVCRIEEEHLWECKQLGAHSPHVLLNTLVYFNTKYFMLKDTDDHLKLSFTHIMKHWKKCPIGRGNTTGRSVYLRYYCPAPAKNANDPNQKKKQKEELPVYEQAENTENPLRCPVKLYEFYLSKWSVCPESIKNRNDAFYLTPERSCVPDSPVWYSTMSLSAEAMNKMLNRVRLVREIQEAMLHTQPVIP